MNKTVLTLLLLYLVLIPVQAVVFNNLILFNVAIPIVFIYVIISLPMTIGTNVALTIGFFTGLTMDIFMDTAGLNALSCTVLAFVRRPVYHLYTTPEDDAMGMMPGTRTMGTAAYLKYLFSMTLIYCFTLFSVEAFQFHNLPLMLLRMACSTAFSFIILLAVSAFVRTRKPSMHGA